MSAVDFPEQRAIWSFQARDAGSDDHTRLPSSTPRIVMIGAFACLAAGFPIKGDHAS